MSACRVKRCWSGSPLLSVTEEQEEQENEEEQAAEEGRKMQLAEITRRISCYGSTKRVGQDSIVVLPRRPL